MPAKLLSLKVPEKYLAIYCVYKYQLLPTSTQEGHWAVPIMETYVSTQLIN